MLKSEQVVESDVCLKPDFLTILCGRNAHALVYYREAKVSVALHRPIGKSHG